MIRHHQRPVVLLEPVPAKEGSFMVKCGELTLKLRLDFTYDRESAEAVDRFIQTYRDLFQEQSVDAGGETMHLGEMQVYPPPRVVPDEKVVEAEFEEAEVTYCVKHLMCRGHDRCFPRWKRWYRWFRDLRDWDFSERPYPWSWE